MDPINVPVKFEVRSFACSELIRGSQKIRGSRWLCPHCLSPPKNPICLPCRLCMYVQGFSRNFRLEFRVGVANLQSWGRGGRRGQGWYRSKERWWVPI